MELRTTRSSAAAILESMSDGFVALNRDWRYTYVNRAAERILRLRREDMLGRTVWDLFPECGMKFANACRRAMYEGVTVHFEDYYAPLDAWFEDNVYPAADGITVLARDITERKRADEEREKLALFVEHSSEFIGLCDTKFMPFFINRAGLKMVGLDSLEEARRTPMDEFFFPEDRAFIREEFIPTVVRDGRGEVEVRFRHFKTREALWIVYSLVALKTGRGELTGLATVSRNISARKQAEEALHAGEQRLQLAQAVAGIGTWEWEPAANRFTWSENMCALFGLAPGKSPGTREEFLDRVLPKDRNAVETTLRRALEEDGPNEVRFRTIWPDGTEHWIIAKGRILKGHNLPLKILGAAMDVTERMQTEQAREAELDRTKHVLRALALRLHSAQEDERRRIARELHDDVAQQLARLQIELQVMQQKPPSDPTQVAKSLEPLTQQIAAASRDLRNLSHRLHPRIVDDLGLEAALHGLLEEFERSYGLNAKLVTGELPRTIPLGLATALYRIAQEALQNIVKHAEGSQVYVAASRTPGELRLSVKDTGPGFDLDEVRAKGGLGLVSMQERAELAGGKLTIESIRGKGTELAVTVPWPAEQQ